MKKSQVYAFLCEALLALYLQVVGASTDGYACSSEGGACLKHGKSLMQRSASYSRKRSNNVLGDSLKDECKNLNNVPFFVLNLPTRPKRHQRFQELITIDAPWMCHQACRVIGPQGLLWEEFKFNVKPELVSHNVWQDALKNSKQAWRINWHTPGSIALTIGHARMWEHALQHEDAAFAVFMEDDLFDFHPQAKEFLCNLTHQQGIWDNLDFMLLQTDASPVNSSTPTWHEEHAFNTGMYIMTMNGIRKVLNKTFPITQVWSTLDDTVGPLWGNLRGGRAFPSIADQAHEDSDILWSDKVERDRQKRLGKEFEVRQECIIPDCEAVDPTKTVIPELFDPLE